MKLLVDYIHENLIKQLNKNVKNKADIIPMPTRTEEVLKLVFEKYKQVPTQKDDKIYINFEKNRYGKLLYNFMIKAANHSDDENIDSKKEDETSFYMSGILYMHALFMFVYMIELILYKTNKNHNTVLHYWGKIDFPSYHENYNNHMEQEKEVRSISKTNAG